MMWKIVLPFVVAILAVGLGSDLPGGPQPVDVNDQEFQRAVDFAVREYNLHSDHHHYYALVEVIKAQSQVVGGMNYIMTLELGKTKCLKYSNYNYCPIITNPRDAKCINCKFTVWYRGWLNEKDQMKVIGASCRERTDCPFIHSK